MGPRKPLSSLYFLNKETTLWSPLIPPKMSRKKRWTLGNFRTKSFKKIKKTIFKIIYLIMHRSLVKYFFEILKLFFIEFNIEVISLGRTLGRNFFFFHQLFVFLSHALELFQVLIFLGLVDLFRLRVHHHLDFLGRLLQDTSDFRLGVLDLP